jgi:hypothetical protein
MSSGTERFVLVAVIVLVIERVLFYVLTLPAFNFSSQRKPAAGVQSCSTVDWRCYYDVMRCRRRHAPWDAGSRRRYIVLQRLTTKTAEPLDHD